MAQVPQPQVRCGWVGGQYLRWVEGGSLENRVGQLVHNLPCIGCSPVSLIHRVPGLKPICISWCAVQVPGALPQRRLRAVPAVGAHQLCLRQDELQVGQAVHRPFRGWVGGICS